MSGHEGVEIVEYLGVVFEPGVYHLVCSGAVLEWGVKGIRRVFIVSSSEESGELVPCVFAGIETAVDITLVRSSPHLKGHRS